MTPIKYDANGRIVTDSAGDIVAWANGLPFTADGSLAVSPAGTVQNFTGGNPLDNDGRVVTDA